VIDWIEESMDGLEWLGKNLMITVLYAAAILAIVICSPLLFLGWVISKIKWYFEKRSILREKTDGR
jgi:hypothetical protein